MTCRFGVIADVQYVDHDDAWDFHHVQRRHYRHALRVATRAGRAFAAAAVDFVLQLGDIVDARNDVLDAAGRTAALDAALRAVSADGALAVHSVLGNHELSLFERSETAKLLHVPKDVPFRAFDAAGGRLRVLLLDAFCESVLAPVGGADAVEAAYARLAQHNSNNVRSNKVDWVAGLKGVERRWLPYNGAHGQAQLDFVAHELDECIAKGQRALVCTHVPLHPEACEPCTLAWDYDEMLAIFHSKTIGDGSRSVVAAVFAGHDHDGGNCVDEKHILHKTLISPLLCTDETPDGVPPQDAYLLCELTDNKLKISGVGLESDAEVDL